MRIVGVAYATNVAENSKAFKLGGIVPEALDLVVLYWNKSYEYVLAHTRLVEADYSLEHLFFVQNQVEAQARDFVAYLVDLHPELAEEYKMSQLLHI